VRISLDKVNLRVNMQNMLRQIVFYESRSGDCPVEEFLESLSPKQAQKTTWVLRLIEELPTIPSSYLKKLVNTDDIWEVRVTVGNNIFRLLGFFDGPMLIVLNHAFQKKTQKTPPQAIKIAESRKRDYFQRKK
jgi:phage-related protein